MSDSGISVQSFDADDPYAPPSPTAPWEDMPDQTTPRVMAQAPPEIQFKLWWSHHLGDGPAGWIPAPGQPGSEAIQYRQPIPRYRLFRRRYYKKLRAKVLQPGQVYTERVKITTGVSTTDSTNVTAQLGFEGKGISASLEVAFGHHVTVSEETVFEEELKHPAPKDRAQQVVFWQEYEEIVALADDGQVVSWDPRAVTAELMMHSVFPIRLLGHLSIPTPQLTNPLKVTGSTAGP